MNHKTNISIYNKMVAARRKHPLFPNAVAPALCLITEEFLELLRASNDEEGAERIRDEALDLIAVTARLLEETLNDPIEAQAQREEQTACAFKKEALQWEQKRRKELEK